MPRTSRRTLVLASAITLTCFTAGFVGAHGTHQVETRIAVNDARAAAELVEDKRAALEASLDEAQAAVDEAQHVVDEHRVAAAAQALDLATRAANESAALGDVLVAAAPVDIDDVADLAIEAAQPELAEPVAEPVQRAAKNSLSGSPTDASNSDRTPSPRATPSPSDVGDPTTPPASEAVAEDDVARVLSGETDSAREARAAAERLKEAAQALDEAREAVDGGSSALSEAALEAKHQNTLALLDAIVERSENEAASARTLTLATADQVAEQAQLTDAEEAVAALEVAVATSGLVSRDDPALVSAQLSRLMEARSAAQTAMNDLRSSHETWIEEENEAIDARNEAKLDEHVKAVEAAREEHRQSIRNVVAARSNGWTGRPLDVSGSNGRLSYDSLCEVDFAPGHRLQCAAAEALEAANAEYRTQTGANLVMTDSYRSYSLQVRTRALKPTTAARPGTSNHGWGMAIDVDRPTATWLADNGADHGWVNPRWARPGGAKPEWWHFEFVATDVEPFQPPAGPELEKHLTSAFESPQTPAE